MHRILVSPAAIHDGTITINDPAAVHHLCDVLRLAVGDPLECFDGQGRSYAGVISASKHRQIHMTIERQYQEPVVSLQIHLAQALIKPQRFEWIIEKATELGVTSILPITTSRTMVRRSSDAAGNRLVRWKRIASEAARQCGRSTVPTIEAPRPFARLFPLEQGHTALFCTLAEPEMTLAQALQGLNGVDHVTLLVGPEGDFTPEEVRDAKAHGARTIHLGRTTLRSETAAIAVLAILQHALGSL